MPALAPCCRHHRPRHPGFGKAKNVIFLWMNGGMTHIDTWDPKTGATKGPTDPIKAESGSGNWIARRHHDENGQSR
jgi:hypothetical protein